MDDFDIYADLPDFDWLKQEYEADVDVKKQELPTSEKDVIELKTKLLKLEKVHKLVLSHYSSLWKTAKQERKRMERQIAELRSQLDNFTFRRHHCQRNYNTVPLDLPINAFLDSAFPENNYQFNYPPPLMSQTFAEQQVIPNLYNYPPPPIHSALTANQENEQEEAPNEHFVDDLAVSSNVITPENSHSSDESDDIVKKSEYRSTVYGERLRKKLLEEKRNAARQKQESLNEKKVNENQSDRQKTKDSENLHKNKDLNALKDEEARSLTQKLDITTIKEENNNRKSSEIDAQNGKAPFKQELTNVNKIEVKDNTKNNELNTESKNETVRKKNDEESTYRIDGTDKKRTDIDSKINIERDLNQRKQDEQLKIERERDLERNREDESRIRQEKDLERREKEEEIERAIQEEQFEKRKKEEIDKGRKEEIEKRKKDEEIEKRKKEEIDKRRKEEIEKRRKDEEIERRKKDEIDKRKKEEIEKRRKDEEIERRKKEEIDKRRKEEIEKRRKDEEIERRKKEEIDKRRREEIEKRRKDEEVERRKKEEIDKRRRAEIEKRRKDEEIEKRKKEEIDKRRREEIEKRRKDEEIERRKKEEINMRRREEVEKRRKEEEIEKRKRDEIAKRRREEQAERRKKEEEQHAKKLKEIEKNRNEKHLEDLIKERERIEREMKNMKDEETEEGEITESFNDMSGKEQSVSKKSQDHKEQLKETCRDKSKQSQKNQYNDRRNVDCKVSGRITRSKSSRENQTIKDNCRKGYHEYASSKSDRHQENHISYDKHKHNNLRSRRDQFDRERERRKSSHRNKSRNRNRSNSGHQCDEDRGIYSPKRIKLQEKDRDHRDKLKDTKVDTNTKIIEGPKRRRQTKSCEKSPQNSKKRKMSPLRDLDCNIKSNKNDAQTSNKLDGKNILDNASSNENTLTSTIENVKNLRDNTKEEKEKLIESLGKDPDEIANKLTNPQTEDQVKDSNENQVKHTNSQDDKKGTNHVKKMKSLMNELFEVQEKPIATLVNLKQVKNFVETSDETILTELEDGEISDSDESTNSKNSPNMEHSQSTDKPIDTVNLFEKNKFEIINSKIKSTPLQKNNEEIVSKGSSEIEDSILYNMLVQSKNNINKKSSKIELHEKASNKKEAVVFEDSNKSESCKEIANKTDNTSSQIINKKQTFVNKTSHIECRVDNSSKTIETKDVNKNVLSEVNENKTVSERNDKINTIIEKEKQSNDEKPNDGMEVKKTNSENSTKCISIPATSNILLEQPRQNCPKINNSENKIDNKEILKVKRTVLDSETNNLKNTCVKENLNVSNDFTKTNIGQPVINEKHDDSSKPDVKSRNTPQDNAVEKSVNTSQTKVSLTTVKRIIVVRRRRGPVQLSDSPPVVVINNMK